MWIPNLALLVGGLIVALSLFIRRPPAKSSATEPDLKPVVDAVLLTPELNHNYRELERLQEQARRLRFPSAGVLRFVEALTVQVLGSLIAAGIILALVIGLDVSDYSPLVRQLTARVLCVVVISSIYVLLLAFVGRTLLSRFSENRSLVQFVLLSVAVLGGLAGSFAIVAGQIYDDLLSWFNTLLDVTSE